MMAGLHSERVSVQQAEQWHDAASPEHSLTWGANANGAGTPFFTPAPGAVQRQSASQVGLVAQCRTMPARKKHRADTYGSMRCMLGCNVVA